VEFGINMKEIFNIFVEEESLFECGQANLSERKALRKLRNPRQIKRTSQ
jgi:hypothetical protein